MLALLALTQCMAISVWMTASSVSGQLEQLWSLSSFQSGLLTTMVQLGFVAGTALLALTNVTDLIDNRKLMSASMLAAGAINALLLVFDNYPAALAIRFLTGLCLAGVYPPGMKMIATWFADLRGFAIGSLVGALTIGKALPYLLKLIGSTWQPVVIWSSVAAVMASVLIFLLYRNGPHQFSRKPFSWALVGQVLKHRPTRLATFGYLGHMWELYAMWTWAPIFIAASAEKASVSSNVAIQGVSFLTIAAGAVGCVLGGLFADKIGRPTIVNLSMLISGICCVAVGLLYGQAFWLLAILMIIWGVFVVSDSAQFSALVTEVAPQHAVGTALQIQTCLGFLLTSITIQLVPVIQDAIGWRYAFAILAVGPAFGIWAIKGFVREANRKKLG